MQKNNNIISPTEIISVQQLKEQQCVTNKSIV